MNLKVHIIFPMLLPHSSPFTRNNIQSPNFETKPNLTKLLIMFMNRKEGSVGFSLSSGKLKAGS